MDAAWRLPNGEWEQGLEATLADCLYGTSIIPCPPDSEAPVVEAEYQTVGPVLYTVSAGQIRLKCSTLSRGDQTPLATAVWQQHLDYMLAADLASNAVNPNLVGSTVIDGSATLTEAFACLEAHAAANLRGGPAYIHLPPEQAVAGFGTLFDRGPDGGFYTAAGTRVVVSAGYTGLNAAFVTGPVRVGFHDTPEALQTVDTSDNTVYLTAWGPIITVIDACATAQVTLAAIVCAP